MVLIRLTMLIFIAILLAGRTCVLVVAGGGMPATFVFGDSLVDAGNNNYLVSLSKANYPPNGIDFDGHQPTGRYTNGRTIVDILGQEMSGGFVPPYLAPETAGDVLLKGVNYASGGGGILNQTGSIFGGRINLDAQIDNYANNRHELIKRHGELEAVTLLRGALFSVTMGSNDFINNYLTPIFGVPERAVTPPEVFVDALISKYREQLIRLYLLDARKIVVANVGPIGCIPYLRDTTPTVGTACAEFPNQLARNFNRKLRGLVDELSANLTGSRFLYADVYRVFSDIIANYKSHGFEVADSACCYVSGRFGGLLPCGPTSQYCADRSKYVFWDPYHPSDAANALIARRIIDGEPADIFPINVRQLITS
ncbi:GDSL esterase/lipase At4g16230 [Oryza sativa Japonica Group]|uniref:Os03g0310000 protein n=6 Tax=Oryza TaxID=4527 RepID=A0A8J8YFG9_ORYSJ|nr:GDSL esterase/lipase At4g16230 isoform X1 [Oryza sativa Japonica Group]ABF95569.1 GDSL-like Lipase/Acylhydrolase family protein, expressed [Oryza sativa Japonica Group]EAZ26684.1 hypothetical protein OsJ_10588 [Oryza sativa Japonica Group]KAF2938923.1 hypothetical protein DAI22_03g153600 [Oryza sativa Japonica Group]BAF11828.1 Os03g0310000 [Oryza sativa Japonica Group]BAS83852.1 Os03g0310000 [Oryza sativa Japonica Group]|eukprot:NP_001049914.1 Os03g0310000 [Oryza sativa Japonica Group]